jgi:hypothetical protein
MKHESTTNSISGTVTDVSAMLVDNTSFRCPEGGLENTRDCSLGDKDECSGTIRAPGSVRRSEYERDEISARPGRKTSIPPDGNLRKIWMTVLSTNSTLKREKLSCSIVERVISEYFVSQSFPMASSYQFVNIRIAEFQQKRRGHTTATLLGLGSARLR